MNSFGNVMAAVIMAGLMTVAPAMAQDAIAAKAQTLSNVHLVAGVVGGSICPDAAALSQ